jgi:hypothetical protein
MESWYFTHETDGSSFYKLILYETLCMKVKVFNVGPILLYGRKETQELFVDSEQELIETLYEESFDSLCDEIFNI